MNFGSFWGIKVTEWDLRLLDDVGYMKNHKVGQILLYLLLQHRMTIRIPILPRQ